jgi:hypothetical protein
MYVCMYNIYICISLHVYMTIGANTKAMEHCNSALNNALARNDKVQIVVHKHLKALILGGQPPCSPLSPAIKSWGAAGMNNSGMGNTGVMPTLLALGGNENSLVTMAAGGGGAGGWEKAFKAHTREGVAEATAGQALVCGTAVLSSVAGAVIGEMAGDVGGVPASPLSQLAGVSVSKAVRLLKVASSVKVGLKHAQLKLGRGWKEAGSCHKVWFLALDWAHKDEAKGSAGVLEMAICNGSEVLHSQVLADVEILRAAEAVFGQDAGATDLKGKGGGGGADDEESERLAGGMLVVEVLVDLRRGAVVFALNGMRIGSADVAISGEVMLAAQMTSSGDRVEILDTWPGGGPKSPRAKCGSVGVGGGRWSVEDRVRILREKGNLAFKSCDYRHAVQVFSLALKLAPDNHVLFRFYTIYAFIYVCR